MARIALISQRYGLEVNGGSEYYTRLIAERLVEKHEVEILTTCALEYTTWENHYEPGLQYVNGIAVRRFPTTQNRIEKQAENDELWIDYQGPVVPGLIKYVKEHKDRYDVFIPVSSLFYPTVNTMPLIAKKSIVVPTAHNDHLIHYPVYRRVFGADNYFEKPSFLMFLTQEESKFVHKVFDNKAIPYDIAGVGVDLPDHIDGNRFRKKFGIMEDYCLYTGRIESAKGCEALFQYFIEYKKRNNSNLKLVLMGKKLIEIPKHEDIIPLGFVSEEDKFDGMSAAKALWLNSIFESLAIVILEAFALGVPVLVNEHCSVLKEHCEKSNAGLYYKGYFEFEGTLNYLLTHDREYAIMSENARRYIEQYYRWDIIMEKFDKAIELVGTVNNFS